MFAQRASQQEATNARQEACAPREITSFIKVDPIISKHCLQTSVVNTLTAAVGLYKNGWLCALCNYVILRDACARMSQYSVALRNEGYGPCYGPRE